MALRAHTVQKFGGTSLANPERIRQVARRVVESQRAGHSVVVVVSAMSGETNRLLNLAAQTAGHSLPREGDAERDALAASGEQVTAALTALAIQAEGSNARSFQAHQVRLHTNSNFGEARITHIETARLKECLLAGVIPVVAGFQGVEPMNKITTLGRGGSDTTAVALAAALGDSLCEIYTDVDGIYSADPTICPAAKKLEKISYRQMLSASALGAKVLHGRSVAIAEKYSVPVHVRSSFGTRVGTWIVSDGEALEAAPARMITSDRNIARVRWMARESSKVPSCAQLLQELQAHRISVERLEEGLGNSGREIVLTLRLSEMPRLESLKERRTGPFQEGRFVYESTIGKVSVIHPGAMTDPQSVSASAERLERQGIPVLSATVSDISFSFLVPLEKVDAAVRVLHDGFEFKQDTGGTSETFAQDSSLFARNESVLSTERVSQ